MLVATLTLLASRPSIPSVAAVLSSSILAAATAGWHDLSGSQADLPAAASGRHLIFSSIASILSSFSSLFLVRIQAYIRTSQHWLSARSLYCVRRNGEVHSETVRTVGAKKALAGPRNTATF